MGACVQGNEWLTAWIMTHWPRSEELGVYQRSSVATLLSFEALLESGKICAFILQLRWRIDSSSS